MKNVNEIKEIIEKIYPLVELGGETSWLYSMRKWHNEIESFPDEIIREILHCCVGQGSFTDFGIYKNSELLYDETSELCALRHKLFDLCVEVLPEISKRKDSEIGAPDL